MLRITAGGFSFVARLEEEDAPETVAAFRRLLPLESRIIHVRWSGEAGWIPFGDLDLGLGPENATCYPHPGEIVLYPGGVSETEILLAYGYVNFASKAGQLAGNHFATIVEGNENLRALGKSFLWEGAQEIVVQRDVRRDGERSTVRRVAPSPCGHADARLETPRPLLYTKSSETGCGKAPIASPRRSSSATAERPSSP